MKRDDSGRIRLKPRLGCSWGRIGRRLTRENTKAVGLPQAEVAEQLRPYRPKADKQREHDGRKIRPKPRLRCNWSSIGRRLTSTEGTRAV